MRARIVVRGSMVSGYHARAGRSNCARAAIAAKPALGDAAKGAGLLLPPPAKGASSVDGSPAPAAFAVDEIPTSRQATIDSRSMANAGITPARPDQIRLRFDLLRKRMFISSTISENAIAK